MVRVIWAIAQIAIKECFRRKIIYFIFAMAILFIILGRGCNPGRITGAGLMLNAAARQNFAVQIGFHIIVFWTILLCSLLSMAALSKDVEDNTLLMVLCRPIKRSSFIAGKLLAVMTITVLNLFLLGSIFFCVFSIDAGILNYRIFLSFFIIIANLLAVSLMGFLFPLFMPRLSAPLLTLVVYMASIWVEIPHYFNKVRAVWEPSTAMRTLHILLPRLGKLQFYSASWISSQPSTPDFLLTLCNVLFYSVVLWFFLISIFDRKQF